jgi:TP901 family phage tail tape measure protein
MASPAAVLDILLTANTTQANAALGKTQAELSATGKAAAVSGAAVKKSLLGIGAVAVGVGVTMFKVGEEFDKSFDKIRTRTGETGKALKGLEQSFKNVVTSVPTDFDSAATAVAGLHQRLDLVGKPLEKLTKQVVQLSKITGTEVQENVESITRLFGDWSIATEDQTKTLDKLYRVSEDTGISVSDLARSMVAFGSPLRQLGIDFDHAAAMFAEFEQAGVNTSTLMPGLRFAIKAFSGGIAATTKDLKAWGISMDDPQKALQEIMQLIKDAPNNLAANSIAFEVFGQRAGPDMAAAIREGHFQLDSLIKAMNTGTDTIGKAERGTRDFSEQWTLFKNRVMVAIQPAATKFFELVGKGMKAIAKIDFKGAIHSLEEFWHKAVIVREVVTGAFRLIAATAKGMLSVFRPAVEAIVALLTGDFGAAWDRVKEIFSNGADAAYSILKTFTAPLRAVLGAIVGALKSIFRSAWDVVKKIWAKGADFILGAVTTIIDAMAKMADAGSSLPGPFGDAFDHIQTGIEHMSDSVNRSREDIRNWANDSVKASKKMKDGMVQNVTGLVGTTVGGIDFMVATTNKALKAFGVEEIAWSTSRHDTGPTGGGYGNQSRQTGGAIYSVPGYGSGDKVPAMLEPGEVVINRKAVAAMGGANKANRINSMIPRFAKGGAVGQPNFGGHPSDVNPNVAKLIATMQGQFPGLMVTATTDGSHVAGSDHYSGDAVDMANASFPYMDRAAGWVMSSGIYKSLKQGIHNPNLHVNAGQVVDPSFYSSVWAGHRDHIHLAIVGALTGAVGQVAQKIAQQMLKGPDGALKDVGQGVLDKVRGAANKYIAKKMPMETGGVGVSGAPGETIKSLPPSLQKYNHIWPNNPGGDAAAWAALPTMPFDKIAELAEWAGLPGVTMAQITKGESGGKPGSLEIGASGPGGSRGVGLWAITPPYANGLKYAGGSLSGDYQPEMFNPVYNAQIANAMAPSGPNANIWHGSGAVTGWDLHYTGAMKQAGGIIQKLAKGTKGTGITPTSYAPPNIPISASGYTPKVVNTIQALAAAGVGLVGDIGHAEIMDAFSWSPSGADLSAGELAGQQGLWRSLIWNRQAQAKLLPKAIRLTKKQPKIQKPLLDMLAAINDPLAGPGSILEALVGLDALTGGGTGAGIDTSTIDALKLAEAQDWARRYQVSQAQYGVFGAQGGGPVPMVSSSAGGANTVVGNADVQVYMLPDGNAHVRVNGQGFDSKVQTATRGYGRRVLPGARGV